MKMNLHHTFRRLARGVVDDRTDSHDTADLCVTEIKKCYQRSAGTAFVYMAGERCAPRGSGPLKPPFKKDHRIFFPLGCF